MDPNEEEAAGEEAYAGENEATAETTVDLLDPGQAINEEEIEAEATAVTLVAVNDNTIESVPHLTAAQLEDRLHQSISEKLEHEPPLSDSQIDVIRANIKGKSSQDLESQQNLIVEQIGSKEQSILADLHSIAELESSIADMQLEMSVIQVAVSQAKVLLDDRKHEMDSSLDELVHIQRMLDTLRVEAARRVQDFDGKLSAANRFIQRPGEEDADFQKRIIATQEAHAKALDLLNVVDDPATREAIAALEKSKIGQTASMIQLIDKQIQEVKIRARLAELTASLDGKDPQQAELIKAQMELLQHVLESGELIDPKQMQTFLKTDNALRTAHNILNDIKDPAVLQELEELQQSKLGKSPSEICRIDEQIEKLKMIALIKDPDVLEQIMLLQKSMIGKSPSEIKLLERDVQEIKARYRLKELEESKQGKTNSEIDLIEKQIALLTKLMETGELFDSPADWMTDKALETVRSMQSVLEGISSSLDLLAKSLKSSKSRKLCEGKFVRAEDVTSVSELSEICSSYDDTPAKDPISELARENLCYVQQHLGRYLRKALGSWFVHQNGDPISYVAQHLLKQRHAELSDRKLEMIQMRIEMERKRREEIDRLNEQRECNPCNPCNECTDY